MQSQTQTDNLLREYVSQTSPSNLKKYIQQKPSISINQFVQTKTHVSTISQFIQSSDKITSSKMTLDAYSSGKTAFRTTTETIAEVANKTELPSDIRSRIMEDQTIGTNAPPTLKNSLTSWMWSYSRPVLMSVAYSVAISIIIYCAWLFLTGSGSWMMFLEMMKYLGVNVVPKAFFKGLQTGMVGITSDISVNALLKLAKSNSSIQKALSRQISSTYLKQVLNRMGVETTNLRYNDVAQTVLSNGMNLAYYAGTGNVAGFFWSGGLKIGVKAGISGLKKTAGAVKSAGAAIRRSRGKEEISEVEHVLQQTGEEIAEAADQVKNGVARSIFDGPTTSSVPRDIIGIVKEAEPVKFKEIREQREKLDTPPNRTEVASDFAKTLADNKSLAFSGIAAVTLTSLAIGGNYSSLIDILKLQMEAYGPQAVGKIGEIAFKGFDIAKNSDIAKITLTNMLMDKIGINKLIDLFSDKLSPSQHKELTSLAAAIKEEKNKSVLAKLSDKFIAVLTGNINPTKLKRMRKKELQNLYIIIHPTDRKWKQYTESQLRNGIIREQSARVSRLNGIVGSLVHATTRSVAATLVYETTTQGYAFINATQQELESQLEGLEGQRQREISEKEAKEFKEKLQVERRTAARVKVKEMQLEIEKREAMKKIEREKFHQRALEKMQEKIEARKLRASALEEKLAREMDVAVASKEGIVHPVPPDEILMPPELQRAMDWEFTPLGQYIAKETAKASTSWIPGIGWAQGAINKVNIGLTTAETVKDIGKIGEVLTRLEMGQSGIEIEPSILGKLDELLKLRLPSVTTLVEDAVKTDRLVAKEVVLRALKDRLIEGWDVKRTAYEIGKKFLGGTGENFGIDVTEAYGAELWNQAFG